MSVHPKVWRIHPVAPPHYFQQFPHLHPVTVQALYNRGLREPVAASAFLEAREEIEDPFALAGIAEAVARIQQALHRGESIAVYGDFDVDGITATALMTETLRALGGSVRPYIPHRVDEGYGLRIDALEHLAAEGIRLVVTVDCGMRSIREVAYARQIGLDVIVTDHHSALALLPPAVAVVNPKRPDARYPFPELAGVGIAYKLAQALLRSQRHAPASASLVSFKEGSLLDLVALGTVADLVPLRGENRTLVREGLERLNRLERPGLEALCRQASVRPGQIDATAISFILGPRLNAAGRMGHARVAYDLLMCTEPAEAERLALELDRLNRERQRVMDDVLTEAREAASAELERSPLIFIARPNFPIGIVGLVAGRLMEEFYRPAVVVEKGTAISRGSARSIAEFHITEALDTCAPLLIQHGGHAAAAGFTVATENLGHLAEHLRALATEQLSGLELAPTLTIDAEVPLTEVSWRLQQELASLGPFGYGNPPPLLLSRGVRVVGQRAVGNGQQHLRLWLKDGGVTWDAIAFRQGEWISKLPEQVDIVYTVEVSEWCGEQRLQLNIQDLRPTEVSSGRLWVSGIETRE